MFYGTQMFLQNVQQKQNGNKENGQKNNKSKKEIQQKMNNGDKSQGNVELTERNHNKDVQVPKKKRTTPHSGCKGFGVCYSKNGAVTWQTFGKRPRYLYGGVWKQVNSVPPTETSTPTTKTGKQSLYTHSKTKDL
ncbi:hypothetical protein Scep_022289 [Stephania cephalantha]|uniref:Uncharacterized protein n=1 Tax=Stephania cephalantha TaxID=152367 RepID=A0AAP0F536_9MAGN